MKRRSRAIWTIWLVVGLVILGLAGAVAAVMHAERNDGIAAARRQTQMLVRATEASLNRNLLGIDLMLAGLARTPGLLTKDGLLDSTAAASEALRSRVEQSLLARDLVLIDRQGRVVAAADPATARLGVDLPAEFLADVLSRPVAQLVVSMPLTSASTAEKIVYLARPLGSNHPASLIALAEVPVAGLSTIMGSDVEVSGLTATFENEQGMILASAPANDSALGQHNPLPLSRLLDSTSGSAAALQAAGRIDGTPAYLSIRPTLYRSLLVSAGIARSAVLARSHEASKQAMLVGGGFALLAMVIGGLVQSSMTRMARATIETERARSVLEEALASMDDGFLLWDADDRVVAWNARYLDLFPYLRPVIGVGTDLQTMIEHSSRAFVPNGDETERNAWINERRALHYAETHEFELQLPDGHVVSVTQRRTANGGTVSIYRDVTRSKAAAQELVAARHVAEAASEAKTRFLATMSHEIRTPLNGVLGMNGLLLETGLDERQRKYAETIRSSGEALLDIVNDVLDMSKLEAGRMAIERAPFDPAVLVEEVVSLLGSRAAAKGINVSVSGSNGLPHLLGDAGRLRQILFNLIGNAIKFTQRGGVMVRAAVEPLANDQVEWIITISDTGIGIPAEALPTLFDRFTQADTSTSRRFGGSGLGLAICRQLVELMHGRIEVHSRVGEGSDFVVSIPLATARTQTLASAESSATAATQPAPPLRVLVAEDNRVNQMLMTAMLERLGHSADVVGDGSEAVQQVQQARYDIVLMDIQMPEMDGAAATRAIRRLPGSLGRIPIIAVSANVLPEQRAAYLAVGMNGYLAKPFDREQLGAAIAELMSGDAHPGA